MDELLFCNLLNADTFSPLSLLLGHSLGTCGGPSDDASPVSPISEDHEYDKVEISDSIVPGYSVFFSNRVFRSSIRVSICNIFYLQYFVNL